MVTLHVEVGLPEAAHGVVFGFDEELARQREGRRGVGEGGPRRSQRCVGGDAVAAADAREVGVERPPLRELQGNIRRGEVLLRAVEVLETQVGDRCVGGVAAEDLRDLVVVELGAGAERILSGEDGREREVVGVGGQQVGVARLVGVVRNLHSHRVERPEARPRDVAGVLHRERPQSRRIERIGQVGVGKEAEITLAHVAAVTRGAGIFAAQPRHDVPMPLFQRRGGVGGRDVFGIVGDVAVRVERLPPLGAEVAVERFVVHVVVGVLRAGAQLPRLAESLFECGVERRHVVKPPRAVVVGRVAHDAGGGRADDILIVEDNDSIRRMLAELFEGMYEVTTAVDGQDALEKVEEASPHIILSDVLMPRMSGIELVKQLKGNLDTCHIPVVLLTARTEIEQNLEGLKIGADDYITKPFDSRLLVFRCNNLVNNRRKLQEYFTKQPTVETPVLATNPLDKEFLDEVIAVFEQHLDDSDFTIDMLAQQMLVSRTRMYAKIKAITGQTPNDFFITLRLKKAAFLLRNNPELNVTQISDQTGFSSPRYFSKLFKKAYQLTPMAYRQGEE